MKYFSAIASVVLSLLVLCTSNGHSTPTGMFSSEGEKVWSADTSIYGKLRNLHGESSACPFRYPGQYEDEETVLYYNRFRYYDAEEGLYVSQDPIRLKGGNTTLYSFVDDPNNWLDILGLSCTKNKKTSYNGSSRREAFREAKRDAGFPQGQQTTI